jgi:two-component system sensor histidine kinase TctE
VGEAVLRFLPRAVAAGVDLGARGIEQPVWAFANAALIEGVLNNLLDNALRYGRSPEGERHITVSVVDAPQAVVLAVIDNGPGVSPEQLKQLTQRWVQGSAGEALKEGSGQRVCALARCQGDYANRKPPRLAGEHHLE